MVLHVHKNHTGVGYGSGSFLFGVCSTWGKDCITGSSCHKYNFLSRQTFSRGKDTFVVTKDVFCRDTHVFVVTNTTKMILQAAPANDRIGDGGRLCCHSSWRHLA